MPLAARAAAIPPITVSTVSGITAPMPINCHQATCYWIYQESTGEAPMGWAWVDSKLSNSTGLMTKLAGYGKLADPATINALANGTVLIFTTPDLNAQHSCILNTNGDIGGYNQQSWFTSLGLANQFTTHAKAHIRWRAGKKNKVFLSNGAKGRLYYVDPLTAITFATYNF